MQKCVVAAAVAAVSLGLTACGGESEARDPSAPLKAARQKAGEQNSYKIKRLTKSAHDETRDELVFSRKPVLTWTKSWGAPRKGAGLDAANVETIGTEDAMYSRSPRQPGDRWLRTDFEGDAAMKRFAHREAGGTLPLWLAALGATGPAKGVTEVGEETVGGKPATHFKGTVVLDDLQNHKGDVVGDLEDFVRPHRVDGFHKVDIDIWIGRDGLPLKARESGTGSKGTRDITEEYSDYGADPKIQVPPAKDTMTAEEYERSEQEEAEGSRP